MGVEKTRYYYYSTKYSHNSYLDSRHNFRSFFDRNVMVNGSVRKKKRKEEEEEEEKKEVIVGGKGGG